VPRLRTLSLVENEEDVGQALMDNRIFQAVNVDYNCSKYPNKAYGLFVVLERLP
jgi:hypothetical protein